MIAVIGGGPAGLAAAETLATAGHPVTIFDRMPSLGRKFLYAGRGGLNITHSEPLERLLTHYGPAAPHLRPALDAFPPTALATWCDTLGEPTFTGTSGRVFPRSFKATPLLRAWLQRLASLGVTTRPNHRWTGWDTPRDTQSTLQFQTPTGPVTHTPRATILALGGASWPRLGSDGTWTTALAPETPVTPLRPANMGFRHPWSPHFQARFAGHPLKRIAATFGPHTIRGEALLTRDGIEGGALYALAAPLRDAIAAHGHATLTLDLRPDLDHAALAARLGGPALSRSNALRRAGLAPAAAALVRELGLPATAQSIKALPLTFNATQGLDRAISTAGGVTLAGLDRWMLPTRPGTFLAGEMLDWEAPTGGYLLQACLSTGRAAAAQALTWLADTRT